MTTETFPIPETPMSKMMAAGHLGRTGHKLTGHLVKSGEVGIMQLVRTCCEEAS